MASLSRAGLFTHAIFHGGTCLKILHGTPRFPEALDFLLKRADSGFEWGPYLARVERDCRLESIHFEVVDRSEVRSTVRKAFFKTDSIGKLILLELPIARHAQKKIRIKLEIDTNPPAGSSFETSHITFPTMAAITAQTLESGFATKSHALLCL